eukprot:767424-Hanusia_phi.AAC.4
MFPSSAFRSSWGPGNPRLETCQSGVSVSSSPPRSNSSYPPRLDELQWPGPVLAVTIIMASSPSEPLEPLAWQN